MKKSVGAISKILARQTAREGTPIRTVLLGLVAIPLFALFVSLTVDTYRRYKADTIDAYRMSGTLLAGTIAQTDLFLKNAKFVLEQLSKRPDVRSLDPAHCDPLLSEIKQLQPTYSTLLTLDVNGNLVCSATKLGPDSATRPDPKNFFDKVSQTQEFTVGRPTVGFVTRRWVSALAYPIFDDAGRFKGAIAAGTDLVNYESVISNTQFSLTTSVGIISTEGVIIARSAGSDESVGSVVDSPAFRIMLNQREGVALAKNHLGERRFYAFAPIRYTEWIAFASIDEASVLAPIIQIALIRMLLVLSVMAVVAWITVWLTRRLANSVEVISKTMDSVGEGALSERAIPQGPAEIRKIATKLNAMLDARDRADLEQQKANDRIRFLAFTDVLTGLPNKTAALEHLNLALSVAENSHSSVAVLNIDLNKLKYVNETYGHAIGDAVIQAVGVRLSDSMRAHMTLSRMMGDEFMVVIEHVTSPDEIAEVCKQILTYLSAPYEIEGLQLVISSSIGVAMSPKDALSSDILLRSADTALSAAKLAGPNDFRFFEPDMNASVIRFMETRNALRLALEQQELEIYYQPQIALSSGKVVGAEALLRWNRPNFGLVMPSAFIDVAEESGLIIQIGKWVLNDVCRQAAIWSRQGLSGLVFAVNLSAVQFRQGRVEPDVYDALLSHNLNPASLELELTESILLQNDEPVLSTLANWKNRGIQLSIDDFGTGYSSLAYLKRLNVDKLKIDQSFVKNLAFENEDHAIVKAIIQIAQALKLTTIAEGVEQETAANQLRALGCDQAQGYLFAKPMPAAEFYQWVKDRGMKGVES